MIFKFQRTFFQSQNTPAEPASDKDSLPEQSSSTDVTSNGTSSDPTSLTEQADLVDEISSKIIFITTYVASSFVTFKDYVIVIQSF